MNMRKMILATIAWMALTGGVTHSYGATMGQINGLLVQPATVIAYDYLFRICAFVFLAALVFVVFIKPSSQTGRPRCRCRNERPRRHRNRGPSRTPLRRVLK